MSGYAHDTGRPAGASRRYRDRLVVGTPTEIQNVIRSTMERGRLVAVTVPRPVDGDRVAVTIRMRPPAPNRARNRAVAVPASLVRHRRPVRRAGVVAAAVAVAVAAVAVLGYAVFLLVKTVWPVLVAVALVVFWLRRKLRHASH